MRILMVSMLNYHFVRWIEQLNDSNHDIFWFDVVDNGKKVERLNWINQKVGWKLRWNFPFRTSIKIKFPRLYKLLQKHNERKIESEFEKYLLEVRPDIVHSFALYISCAPILNIMNKYPNIKWIFSSWGSDLYDYQNYPDYLIEIRSVLKRVNYLLTDCNRDYKIAKRHGFKNVFLGVLPGGGGYYLDKIKIKKSSIDNKNIILIKGFEGRWGRAVNILKAITEIQEQLSSFSIIVFGADDAVIEFVKKSSLSGWKNFNILGKIQHDEVLNLMGQSFLYIGNSVSDGIPNSMIEAICMDVFPIQSNPGGASQELLKDGFNGLLIEDSENIGNIRKTILLAINNNEMIKRGIEYNNINLAKTFDYEYIKDQTLKYYFRVYND